MNNHYEIKRKVNLTYGLLILLSLIIMAAAGYFEWEILTEPSIDIHPFVYMILGIMLPNILLFELGNIIMIICCKLSSFPMMKFIFALIICSYVSITVFFIKEGYHPEKLWQTILGVVVTLIVFCVGMLFAYLEYENICTMQKLIKISKQLMLHHTQYRIDVDKYKQTIGKYNKTNERIGKIGESIDKKYKYKKLSFKEGGSMPQYDVSNIHLFSCDGAYDYFKSVERYQTGNIITQSKMKEQTKKINSFINGRENLLKEVERNSKRIDDFQESKGIKKIFQDTTRPGYDSLKKKTHDEKKIKTIRKGW